MNNNITVAAIKKANRNNIFMLLKRKPNLSKQDIMLELKLSLPTVTTNLNQFLEEGLIWESGAIGNAVGRKASTFSIVDNARVAIGIDITKNHVSIVCVNLNGAVEYEKKLSKKFELKESYYKFVAEAINDLIVEQKYCNEQLLGVGIGIPGLVTADGNTIFYGKTMTDFSGLQIDSFQKYIASPCVFIKDADAACLAEAWSSPEMDNIFYISLSNYVGGSLRLYNKEYTGEGRRSAEVGHITIIPDGLRCYCGQKGCVDPYCSALRLSEKTNENLAIFFEQLEQANSEYVKLFDDYLYYLTLAINNVRMLFDCKVVLGGYVGAYLDPYMEKIKEKLAKKNSFEQNGDYVQICKWKRNAIAAGAAILYIDQFISGI